MGYYIETGTNTGKAKIIAEQYNGVVVSQDEAAAALNAGEGVIVVVDNGLFEAAAFAFDLKEFEVFTDPFDVRPKTFVVIDREVAKTAARYKGK